MVGKAGRVIVGEGSRGSVPWSRRSETCGRHTHGVDQEEGAAGLSAAAPRRGLKKPALREGVRLRAGDDKVVQDAHADEGE